MVNFNLRLGIYWTAVDQSEITKTDFNADQESYINPYPLSNSEDKTLQSSPAIEAKHSGYNSNRKTN